jgi:hypothetical protein
MTTFLRRLRLLLVVTALLAAVWFGVKEGLDGVGDAGTLGQKIAASLQVLYGVAALGCLFALLVRRSWSRVSFVIWTAVLSAAAGVASVAWGGTGWGTAALAGLGAAAIAGLVSWGAIAHLRGKTAASTSDAHHPNPRTKG